MTTKLSKVIEKLNIIDDEVDQLEFERRVLLKAMEEIAELNPQTPNEYYEIRNIARKALRDIN